MIQRRLMYVRTCCRGLAEAEVAAARSGATEAARSGAAAARSGAGAEGANQTSGKAAKRERTFHSAALFAARAEPVWTGTYVFRGLVETAKLAERWPGHPAMTVPFQVRGLSWVSRNS